MEDAHQSIDTPSVTWADAQICSQPSSPSHVHMYSLSPYYHSSLEKYSLSQFHQISALSGVQVSQRINTVDIIKQVHIFLRNNQGEIRLVSQSAL